MGMLLVRALAAFGMAALAGCAPGRPATGQPEPIAEAVLTHPVDLPEFESDRGVGLASSAEEYAVARADTRFIMERFAYESDGLAVSAYLYRPREAPRRSRPIIVFNRGSFTRPDGFAGEMLVMAHRYAQAGFIVVAPHYRGSSGAEGRDELGGADVADLMNIVPWLDAIPGADVGRVFLAGESRGGMMVYQAMRDGFPARAAAVWGAFSDLEPMIAPGGLQERFAPLIWPDINENYQAIIERRSAVRWAHRINTPVLIMHGGADESVPVEQSQRMAEALERLDKMHDLIVFEGQPHVIGGRSAERDAAAISWFRRFGSD